jgi:NhaP-type Na+/H+ or K+/H+ antiporter
MLFFIEIKINETLVFSILLPPMIFAQGFTLKKASFIKNLKYIAVFGILGTFLSFFMTTFLIYEANQLSTQYFI